MINAFSVVQALKFYMAQSIFLKHIITWIPNMDLIFKCLSIGKSFESRILRQLYIFNIKYTDGYISYLED